MAFYAKSQAPKREPIPEGQTPGVCYQVIMLGTQHNEKFGKDNPQVLLTFECSEHRIQIERDGKQLDLPRAISATFTISDFKLARLRKFLEAWKPQGFVAGEMAKFDLSKLLGQVGLLNITHQAGSDGTVYANIGSIGPLPKAMQGSAYKAENQCVAFDIDNVAAGLPEVPEWIRERIKGSKEYKAAQASSSLLDHVAPPLEQEPF